MTNRRVQTDSESDYEIVGSSPGRKPGGVVSVRLKPDEMDLLVALSEVAGRTLSDTLRLGLACLGDAPRLAHRALLRVDSTGTQGVVVPSSASGSQPSVENVQVYLVC